jgi:hypothetical protein
LTPKGVLYLQEFLAFLAQGMAGTKLWGHYLVDGQGNVHPSVGQLLGFFLKTLGSEFFENSEIKEPSVSF